MQRTHDMEPYFSHRRLAMARHLGQRGIRDSRVIDAMAHVPREQFVPPALVDEAYKDRPLAIGAGQTISQPYIVALMAEAAAPDPGDRVLEIGTGSGYGAAVLGLLADVVHTVERLPGLAATAAERLASLGHANVHVHFGDGTRGWPEHAPYDAVIVTAAGPHVPQSLITQLAEGGRLVMPVGSPEEQQLVRLTNHGGQLQLDDLGPVQFVPLIGRESWNGHAA